jgi:proteic killer suppression protein
MLAYLVAIEAEDELKMPPNYGAHQLTGDRSGVWSLTVAKNWRMTFRVSNGHAIEHRNRSIITGGYHAAF